MASTTRWGGDQPGYAPAQYGAGYTGHGSPSPAGVAPYRPPAGSGPPTRQPWSGGVTMNPTNVSPPRGSSHYASPAAGGASTQAGTRRSDAISKYNVPAPHPTHPSLSLHSAAGTGASLPASEASKYAPITRQTPPVASYQPSAGATRYTPAPIADGTAKASSPAHGANPHAPSSGELQRLREAVLAAEARVHHFEKSETGRQQPLRGNPSPTRVPPPAAGTTYLSDAAHGSSARVGAPGLGVSKTPPPARPNASSFAMNAAPPLNTAGVAPPRPLPHAPPGPDAPLRVGTAATSKAPPSKDSAAQDNLEVLKEMRAVLSEFRAATRQTPKPPASALSPPPATPDAAGVAELRMLLEQQRETLQGIQAAVAARSPASQADGPLAEIRTAMEGHGAALSALAANVDAEMRKPAPVAALPPPGLEALRDMERSLREREELQTKQQQQLLTAEAALQERLALAAQREQQCDAREARAAELEGLLNQKVAAAAGAPVAAPASEEREEQLRERERRLAEREARVDAREQMMEEREHMQNERDSLSLMQARQHMHHDGEEDDSIGASPRRKRKSPAPKVEKYFEGILPENAHEPRVEDLSDSDEDRTAPEVGKPLAEFASVPPTGVPAEELEALAAEKAAEAAAAERDGGDGPDGEHGPGNAPYHEIDDHEDALEVADPEALLRHLLESGVPPEIAEAMVHQKLAEMGMAMGMVDEDDLHGMGMGMHPDIHPDMHPDMHPGMYGHPGVPQGYGYEMETD